MRFRFEQPAFARLAAVPCRPVVWAIAFVSASFVPTHATDLTGGAASFRKQIRPILEEYCFDCHADGANKGNVAFDELKSDHEILDNHGLWLKALKNLRAGLMPPSRKPQPSAGQKQTIEQWIKSAVFKADPRNPDPGRVTLRRLNRVEYHNTIRDLMGVNFDTEKEFPADDSSYGFDNIGDVLTLPPMLLEKYFAAARAIVSQAVPSVPALPEEKAIPGRRFKARGDEPKGFARFFPKPVPEGVTERRQYAREILEDFTRRAFRRPPEAGTVERLVALSESTASQPGKTFEAGIGQAMVAVLSSPRFLFRAEGVEAGAADGPASYPLVDEYALASRLSYFLWSSMPDAELLSLAGCHELRPHLSEQVHRMLADAKSESFIRNFVGQWLQVRDITTVPIDARQVLQREASPDPDLEHRRQRFRALRDKDEAALTPEEKKELEEIRASFARRFSRPPAVELDGELRRAMRLETEKTFEYVLRENRNLLELLDCDYTFLNERLARHYSLTNLDVKGDAMRLVKLPPDSPRGGILTDGAVLAVTSNPTRTSPVKRGLFVLDNLLGTPPAPPPPNLPALEDAANGAKGRTLTLRETLALHRQQALCSSCHDRMDPLGLALDNFNALGMWRGQEKGQPIDAAGKLLTGEGFSNVQELKHILVSRHATEFYRTLTEKMLTYALGRGLEYYDVATVDGIVDRIQRADGRPSALLAGIVESAPFQRTRFHAAAQESQQSQQPKPRAGARLKL